MFGTAAVRRWGVVRFLLATTGALVVAFYSWALIVAGAFGGSTVSSRVGCLLFIADSGIWITITWIWLGRARDD